MWNRKAKVKWQVFYGIGVNPHLERPSQKSLFPEELQIVEKKFERGTYLQEARPPMDKDIPEDSPIVFEKAIKSQAAQCWARRGTSAAGRGAGSPQMQQSFVQEWRRRGICLQHPAAAAQHCIAGEGPCSKAGARSQLIFLQIHSWQGGEHKDSSPPLDVYVSLLPSNEIRNSGRYFVSSSWTSRFYLPIQ